MMQSASREASAGLTSSVDTVVNRFSSADGLTTLASELYAVAGVLVGQPRLRRMLADPASAAERRAELADTLFSGKVGTSAMNVVKEAVSLRWSRPWDMIDSIESAGNNVLLAAAEQDEALDAVEDELFRFERILDAQSQLSSLLDEASADVERRTKLLADLLDGKVHAVTLALLEHAVISERKRSVVLAIDDLIEAAAKRRERSLARVVSAIDLNETQQRGLSDALSQMYGRRIDVRYAVDPSVRGGLVVRVGDEVIDGSIATRLTQARAAFTT